MARTSFKNQLGEALKNVKRKIQLERELAEINNYFSIQGISPLDLILDNPDSVSPTKGKVAKKGKRKMSAAGKAKIRAAQKARWAKIKADKKTA